MKQETKEEQKCRNCKYFIKHCMNIYGKFKPLVDGHCINCEVPKHISSKLIDKNKVCERWGPIQLQIEERREYIGKILKSMAKDISDIAQILKDDN